MNEPLYIAGLDATIGTASLPVTNAVEAGHYEGARAEADGYLAVAREPVRAPFEMALQTAQAALAEAKCNSGSISAMAYASIHRHGHPRLWTPASWVQRHLDISGQVPALTVMQGCNGLLQSMIALHPLCTADDKQILLVGADRFENSGFDRWSSDYGLIYGDAAAALVLSKQTGFARVLHLALDGAPALEELHRDPAPTIETAQSWRDDYDVRRSKRAFLATHGHTGFTAPLNDALKRLHDGLLANPQWNGSVDWLFTPFVGNTVRVATYDAIFGPLGRHSGWDIGQSLGHLGTTDGWVGLENLRQRGLLKAGDRVLIVSAGVGFSCGLVLLEIL
jgi:3-oxoacyl-[acyl-carrier-protein] synthase-3